MRDAHRPPGLLEATRCRRRAKRSAVEPCRWRPMRPARFSTAGVDECWGKHVDKPRTPSRGKAAREDGEKMTSARKFIHRACGWKLDKDVDKRVSALQGRRVKRLCQSA